MKVSEVDFKCLRSGVMPVGIPRATASREAMPYQGCEWPLRVKWTMQIKWREQ